MSDIEWTDRTWNPVRGCSIVSDGCKNCYAMKQAHRFSGKGQPYEGLTKLTSRGPVWTGAARFVPKVLAAPLSWKKPQRVFVNSMSDLFHDDVTNEQIAAVFAVMAACPQHTFQILTKRPLRMRQWFEWIAQQADHLVEGAGVEPPSGYAEATACQMIARMKGLLPRGWTSESYEATGELPWPLPNVWLGVSVENQDVITGRQGRIFHLIDVPAAVRFLSIEPLLGPVDLTRIEMFRAGGEDGKDPYMPGVHYDALRSLFVEPDELHETPIDWVIVGGESGPGARVCDVEWVESVVKQCAAAGTPVFVKQLGAKSSTGPTGNFRTGPNGKRQFQVALLPLADRKGGDIREWPEHLQVRQFPTVSP